MLQVARNTLIKLAPAAVVQRKQILALQQQVQQLQVDSDGAKAAAGAALQGKRHAEAKCVALTAELKSLQVCVCLECGWLAVCLFACMFGVWLFVISARQTERNYIKFFR